jgi:hypothetical protein
MILRLITAYKVKKGRHLSMPPSLQRKRRRNAAQRCKDISQHLLDHCKYYCIVCYLLSIVIGP